MNCERCETQTQSFTFSYFNVDRICLECQTRERNHPDFEKARKAELDSIKKGDWNFPGIGKPQDL